MLCKLGKKDAMSPTAGDWQTIADVVSFYKQFHSPKVGPTCYFYLFIYLVLMFIYFEREREYMLMCTGLGEGQRERGRDRKSQAGSALSAQSQTGGLIS